MTLPDRERRTIITDDGAELVAHMSGLEAPQAITDAIAELHASTPT